MKKIITTLFVGVLLAFSVMCISAKSVSAPKEKVASEQTRMQRRHHNRMMRRHRMMRHHKMMRRHHPMKNR